MNLDAVNYLVPTSSSRRVGASGRTTSTANCSRRTSSSCRRLSTTRLPASCAAQLIHLESENPDKDINIYINSPGGDITALFAIYDTMQFIKNDIATICLGQAASAAAVLLAAGHQGQASGATLTPVFCCTSRTARSARARSPISSSWRPRRSCGCAS